MVKSKFLIDSNVLSEPLRTKPNLQVMERLRLHSNELATASVVWHELWFGVRRLPQSRKRDVIEAYLLDYVATSVAILPYDELAARWHATERARLEGLGRPLPFADSQIGAVAAVNGLTLVTRNAVDFEAMEGLDVENWFLGP